jgi:hypothetical protein
MGFLYKSLNQTTMNLSNLKSRKLLVLFQSATWFAKLAKRNFTNFTLPIWHHIFNKLT